MLKLLQFYGIKSKTPGPQPVLWHLLINWRWCRRGTEKSVRSSPCQRVHSNERLMLHLCHIFIWLGTCADMPNIRLVWSILSARKCFQVLLANLLNQFISFWFMFGISIDFRNPICILSIEYAYLCLQHSF